MNFSQLFSNFNLKTLTAKMEGVSLESLSTLPTQIGNIIKNPQSNIVAALLMLAIVIVFIIVIVLSVVAFISRPKGTVLVESYTLETDDLDEEGSPQELYVENEYEIPKDPSHKYYVVVTMIIMLVVMWMATGVTTQVTYVCETCHTKGAHVESSSADPHESVRCVQCHESAGLLGSLTTAVPARIAHIVVGTFKSSNVPDYKTFPTDSCLNCHKKDISTGVVMDDETGVSVSHKEPIEAGMNCMTCHMLDENKKVTSTTVGMQPCLNCHDNRVASAQCEGCHGRGVKIIAAAEPSPNNAQQLVPPNANQRCYDCHSTSSCDPCHAGVRMPHAADYATNHADDVARLGASACHKCHPKGSGVPGACLNCHTTESGGW